MQNTLRGPNSEPSEANFSASPKPTPHHIKSYYISGTKMFLRRYTEIYRYLLSKPFQNAVLGRQEMMQCKRYFLRQTETCLLENL